MGQPAPPFIITDFQVDFKNAPLKVMYWECFGTDGYTYDKWATVEIHPYVGVTPEYTSLNNYSAYGYLSFGSKPIVNGQTFWGELIPLNWETHQLIVNIPYCNCYRLWLRPGVHGGVSMRAQLRRWMVPVQLSP